MAASTHTAKTTFPGDEQILITREFDAPPHLVYRAWTTPELVKRWWSGEQGEVTIAEIDLRVGGAWRYVLRTGEGVEVGFHGVYREIVPGERVVATEVYEGMPEGSPEEAVVTTTVFAAVDDGRTKLTQLVDAGSKELRDVMVNSGMETGVQQQMDALERVALASV